MLNYISNTTKKQTSAGFFCKILCLANYTALFNIFLLLKDRILLRSFPGINRANFIHNKTGGVFMNITLTQKERMLLEDQKSHEEICIEKYGKYASQAQDAQLKQICLANQQSEQSHLNTINQMLSGTIPDLNQQQSQPQQPAASSSQTNASAGNVSDKYICSDLLSTEKYVSGTYDTTIFEFKDTAARDVLNHIQKEEQKHGESIFMYMNSKGMYTPK